jgi:hypothetical protein
MHYWVGVGHNGSDSLHAQAQILLEALQSFIIPFVQSVSDGQLKRKSEHSSCTSL